MPVVSGPILAEAVEDTLVKPLVADCVKEDLKPIYDPDDELKKVSRRLLRCQKYALASGLISINAVLIFCSWYLMSV